MKILLLGEFSALHKNLRDGLVALGHEVTIASNGNGWKEIPSDIDLSMSSNSLFGRLTLRKRLYQLSKLFSGYDVVQLINPFVFPTFLFPYKTVMQDLKNNNGQLILLAAGSDPFFWKYGREKLKYGPFNDYLKYDLKKKFDPYETDFFLDLNAYCVELVHGVIPVMYEYQASYEHCKNLRGVIPLPVNLDECRYSDNTLGNKLVVFHGLNRPGFKGTHYVRQAFDELSRKYQSKVDLIIDGKMPLAEYLKLMRKTNIVIDQTNSYSLGLNGVYALAMGKIVLGGAEPESLSALNVTDTPVFNIRPGSDDIISVVESFIDNQNLISDISRRSRGFAEKVHGHIEIAEKYVGEWTA